MKKGLVDNRVQEVLGVMRKDGEKWPNLGEAYHRVGTRKKIENRIVPPENEMQALTN